jgi:alpha-galactosidase
MRKSYHFSDIVFGYLLPLVLTVFLQTNMFAQEKLGAHPVKPVRISILAGQSNMEGAGVIAGGPKQRNGGKGTLEFLVNKSDRSASYQHTIDSAGNWRVRNDVWIWYLGRKGGLTVGYGAKKDRIGPEFQFGHTVGKYFEEPVLLIKVAWGGKSLAKDFRPPSSGGQVGAYYQEMLKQIASVTGNLSKEFPELENWKVVLSGFGWHQGWNDGSSKDYTAEYRDNLINFIKDVRQDLDAPNLPFVIANSGFAGWQQKVVRRLDIIKAQGSAAKIPEFSGSVSCVETRDFYF